MSTSSIFAKAHTTAKTEARLARAFKSTTFSYRAAFAKALKAEWAIYKKAAATRKAREAQQAAEALEAAANYTISLQYNQTSAREAAKRIGAQWNAYTKTWSVYTKPATLKAAGLWGFVQGAFASTPNRELIDQF